MTESFRFPKSRRLLKPSEFDRVFKRRRSASDHVLVAYACENEMGHVRLGLAASRKYGGAVERNRWKRRVREAFRTAQHEMPAGIDLVVLPRGPGAPATDEMRRSLIALAKRIAEKL